MRESLSPSEKSNKNIDFLTSLLRNFLRDTRKLVKENILEALRLSSLLKLIFEQTAQTSKELDKILDFNSQLIKFGNHPNASRFARGLGTIFLLDGDRGNDDMKLPFRRYVLDSLSGVRIEEKKRAALNQLRNIFGICERESKAIIVESALQLFDQISARHLKASASQADFPNNPPALRVAKINEETYRHKLRLFASKGKRSDMDIASLALSENALKIPRQTVEAAHADICRCVFEKIVTKAIDSGVDRYDADFKQSVRNAVQGFRLTRGVAMSIASKAVSD